MLISLSRNVLISINYETKIVGILETIISYRERGEAKKEVGISKFLINLHPQSHISDKFFFTVLDAGIRTPRGILTGNVIDLGNYYQCLGIHKPIPNSVVEGKYCMIHVPLNQEWPSLPSTPTLPDFTWPEDFPDITWPGQNPMNFKIRKDMVKRSREYELATAGFDAFNGAVNNDKR